MVNYLGYGYMGLEPKLFAFLYKLWLESGSIALMRWRLSTVKAIITDFGTESELADTADVLPEFIARLGYEWKVQRVRYMFPFAIWSCGWHHMWDHISEWVAQI